MANIRNIVWPNVDWGDSVLVTLPRLMIPYVVGMLEKLHYRALYATDADYEYGNQDVLRFELLIGQAEGTMSIESVLEDLVEQVEQLRECVCNLPNQVSPGDINTTIINYWYAQGVEDGRPTSTPTQFEPEVDDLPDGYASWEEYYDDACDFAQEMFLANYHTWDRWITNVLAVGNMTIDVLDAALLASGVGAGLTFVLGLFSQLLLNGPAFQEDKEAGATILGLKEDLVCAVYNGGSAVAAAAEAQSVIDAAAGELTTLSYLWLKAMYSSQMLALAFSRGIELTHQSEFEEGYCEACLPVVVGEDWYAVPVPSSEWTFEAVNTGYLGEKFCWPTVNFPGKTLLGFVCTITADVPGFSSWRLLRKFTAGCGEDGTDNWFPDSAENYTMGRQLYSYQFGWDRSGCAEYFDATLQNLLSTKACPATGACLGRTADVGWTTMVVEYIVVAGAPD